MSVCATMPPLSHSARQGGSRAQEDYLEQIHTLIEDKGYARVVDIAGNDESAVVTEQLAQAGHTVCVATPLPTVGAFLGWTHLADYVPRLLELGCEIEERTAVTSIADGQVSTQSLLGGAMRTRAFDGLVLLQPRIANTALEAPLRTRKLDVHLVGDAQAPRDAATAFVQGEMLGRSL